MTYVKGGHRSGGVAGDELELHIELAVEVLIPGLESRARILVEGEHEELPVVEDLGAAITPSDVYVLIEVTS